MIQGNALLIVFLILFIASASFETLLSGLNIRHLCRHGHQVPPVFAGHLDGNPWRR